MFNTKIEISSDPELLDAIKQALEPEIDFKTARATYDLKLKKNQLIINVKAEDATAFRAVTSSLTSLISLIEKAWKELKNGKGNSK